MRGSRRGEGEEQVRKEEIKGEKKTRAERTGKSCSGDLFHVARERARVLVGVCATVRENASVNLSVYSAR